MDDRISLLPELLLPWFEQNKRDFPWRHDREPYHVWLSEIMLQQTRTEAVKGYYTRFLEALPDIPALAACDDDRLSKLWEGLGYYSRMRNLKKAALKICTEYGGSFPSEYEAIRSLPGIGDYTAGAVSSICFEMPEPAVDGNVLRAVTRFTASRNPVTRPETKKAVSDMLRSVYPAQHCGDFTQALMELGACICIPVGTPLCGSCPLSGLCRSRAEELWRSIPVKDAKKPRREEKLTVLILQCGEYRALLKRPNTGLLAGLWEFPNLPGHQDAQAMLEQVSRWGCRPSDLLKENRLRHIFTHVEWDMKGYYLRCREMPERFTWVTVKELAEKYALPTAFRQFFLQEPEQ